MAKSGIVVGIDLGTTNSCIAVMDGDDVIIISNSEGSRTTPSVVAFTEDGERLVGQIAKRQAITNPGNTVYASKRLLGRKHGEEPVQRLMKMLPYDLVSAANGDVQVSVWGKSYSASELAAQVLTKMKESAEAYLGESVNDVVVTVRGNARLRDRARGGR